MVVKIGNHLVTSIDELTQNTECGMTSKALANNGEPFVLKCPTVLTGRYLTLENAPPHTKPYNMYFYEVYPLLI